MFSKIILATDGSEHADQALKVAIDLAQKYQAELTIAHVLTQDHPTEEIERILEVEHLLKEPTLDKDKMEHILLTDAYDNHGMMRQGDREARAVAIIGEQILKAAMLQVEKVGLETVKTAILSGDYANAILKLADDLDADMIVMGRRGLSTLKGLIIGSVSYKVSQRARCSVLTVK